MSKSIADQVVELLLDKASKGVMEFTRREIIGNWSQKKPRDAAAAKLLSLTREGKLQRFKLGSYRILPEQVKNAGVIVQAATEETKRAYKRRAAGPTGDAIIYLNHARNAMKNKDAPEYMLVSLALYTLQGKMS
jgi:mRNA-degrading endonuclease RelE of RelBE toxin-antitoxin system